MKDLILDHKDDFRMYGLVPYNISPIQQGIQFGHALQEYNNIMMSDKPNDKQLEAFDSWRKFGKTFIVLNGGTTNTRIVAGKPFGSLNQHLETLNEDIGIITGDFYEPDLGEQLTAIAFIVPKQVYNKKDFLNFKEYTLNTILDSSLALEINEAYDRCNFENQKLKEYYEEWTDYLGGEQNVKLRYFLSQFKFA